VLKGLNEMCGSPFGMDKLYALGARVGADVPFCMHGGTAACTGIGDRMNDIVCCDFSALIAVPDFACSTADAYRRYDISPIPEKSGFEEYKQMTARSRSLLAENMYNVFELLYDDSRIADLKGSLISAGAEGACMTGSGSAVFGIFPDKQAAQKAADSLTDCTSFAVNAI
ncbi:MAG: 4-(cytidine 5'-diphospho)-2-C-methyl-D-erythritol kinase, partial [Ruminiclostridium sp.]|nr:4-(cytidine 5'-diphospho)-2-C-methyl-D-erythritol kinase [Ruminiclostridium sp.]